MAAMQIPDLNFRDIIDLRPVYISIQDKDLRILFANQTFKTDFGDGTGQLCHQVYKGSATT